MNDIFEEEVDEELSKERWERLWEKWAPVVWGILALAIGGVGFREYLVYQEEQKNEVRTVQFEDAISKFQEGLYDDAVAGLQTIVDEDNPMSPIAGHYLASTYLEGKGDQKAAEDVLEKIGKHDGEPFEQLAMLKLAYLRSNAMTREELMAYLQPLIDEESPFGALAQELLAAKAWKEGDYAEARNLYSDLQFMVNAPPGLATRANIALAVIPKEKSNSENNSVEPQPDAQ